MRKTIVLLLCVVVVVSVGPAVGSAFAENDRAVPPAQAQAAPAPCLTLMDLSAIGQTLARKLNESADPVAAYRAQRFTGALAPYSCVRGITVALYQKDGTWYTRVDDWVHDPTDPSSPEFYGNNFNDWGLSGYEYGHGCGCEVDWGRLWDGLHREGTAFTDTALVGAGAAVVAGLYGVGSATARQALIDAAIITGAVGGFMHAISDLFGGGGGGGGGSGGSDCCGQGHDH